MADVRRAYRAWLYRRLAWLTPSFLLGCGVFVTLAAHPELPIWARLPSLTLSAGAAVLILVLALQSIRVVRERSAGRIRGAQQLRSQLRLSPGIVVVLLLLLGSLLGVPSLLTEITRAPVSVIHRPAHDTVAKRSVEPVVPQPMVVPGDPERIVEGPVRAPDSPHRPIPAPAPQILPEIARIPELPLSLGELELPAPPKAQDTQPSGEERFGMKHRPTQDDELYGRTVAERHSFSRSGVPSESDLESWTPPNLRLDILVVSPSGPWRGGGLEISYDLPVGRDDSVRLTYTAMMLTDEEEIDGPEPSFTWHRGTVEYVRRIAGYTRHAAFDLAVRIGMTMDRLSTHEAGLRFNSALRLSPFFGLESAIWEDDGVGLIVQVGHSPATRLTEGASRVTDFRVLVRIDLGDHSLMELGYRVVSVRFRDKHGPSAEDYTDKMERSFMGPVFGLALRF